MFMKILKTTLFYVLGGPIIGGLFLCFCLLYGVAWITKGYHISDELCESINELFEEV